MDDALRAVTIEAAYSWQKENELGSICPGKIASFTVLDQDPRAVEPMKLKDIPIRGTVFEGRIFPIPAKARKSASATREPSLRHDHMMEGPEDGSDPHGGDPCGVARQVARALMANWKEQQGR